MFKQIKNKAVDVKNWIEAHGVDIAAGVVMGAGALAVIALAIYVQTRPVKIVADFYNPETGYMEHRELGEVAYDGKVTWNEKYVSTKENPTEK